jgi:hypothetical protein
MANPFLSMLFVIKSETPKVTLYAPGAGGSMEGAWATSKPDLSGKHLPKTLDDVRLGHSDYVTLAAAPSNYGKFYKIDKISYVSPLDGQSYTLNNVLGFVHDTGSAFIGNKNKVDVAVGDFKGWAPSSASQFVKYGFKGTKNWEQVSVSIADGSIDPLNKILQPKDLSVYYVASEAINRITWFEFNTGAFFMYSPLALFFLLFLFMVALFSERTKHLRNAVFAERGPRFSPLHGGAGLAAGRSHMESAPWRKHTPTHGARELAVARNNN